MMYMFFRLFCVLSAMILAAGCSKYDSDYKLPGVYRIDVQQGNVIEQDMLDKLKPGMDKTQVRFIMGTPAVEDPFHSDRWDYVYTISKGGSRRKQRHLILYFNEDKLAYVEGGVIPGLHTPSEEFKRQTTSVDVPLRKKKSTGFFSRILSIIPFVGDDDPPPPTPRERQETKNTAEHSH